jgi:hypothetical protein
MSNYISLIAQLQAELQGTVTDQPGEHYTTDFGGMKHKTPLILVKATCEQDILHTLKVARAASLPVIVRGAGHSSNGQTLTDGGIILENFIPAAQIRWLNDQLVEVSGRSNWYHVEQALNAAGRQTPVLTDYLEMSVGGTLSVGGIGLTSICQGFQVDQVQRLRLIKPDSEAIWCSPQENPELFRFALAGLGQIGIIESIVMRTEPYRPLTHLIKRQHDSLQSMVESIPLLAAPGSRVEHFSAALQSGQFISEYGDFSAESSTKHSYLPPELVLGDDILERSDHTNYRFEIHHLRHAWLQAFDTHYTRIWADYILDYPSALRFAAFLDQEHHKMGALQAIYLLAVKRPATSQPFPLLPAPPGDLLVSFGLYAILSPWRIPRLLQTLDHLQAALDLCLSLGGRPYLHGFTEWDEAKQAACYGPAFHRLQELRQQLHAPLLNPHAFFPEPRDPIVPHTP